MAKSQALVFAEAQIQNQNAAIAAMEARMAELMLALASKPAAAQPVAEHPQVALKAQPEQPKLPVVTDMHFSVTRPLLAVFQYRFKDDAFAYRESVARETPGRIVRVHTVLGPDRFTPVCAVY